MGESSFVGFRHLPCGAKDFVIVRGSTTLVVHPLGDGMGVLKTITPGGYSYLKSGFV